MKRRDLILVGTVLLAALASFGLLRLVNGMQAALQGSVEIYIGNKRYGSYPLDGDQTIRVEQANGKVNVVRIVGGSVWMEAASCKNHDCITQGILTRAGAVEWDRRWIVCLPNQVTVELKPGEV